MKFILFLSLPFLLVTGIYSAMNGVFMAAFFSFFLLPVAALALFLRLNLLIFEDNRTKNLENTEKIKNV
jgi:hypothetical protein